MSMISATGVGPWSNEVAVRSFEVARTKLHVIFFGFSDSRNDLVNQEVMILKR